MGALLTFDRARTEARNEQIALEYAVDRVLGNTDEFSEWLGAECYLKTDVTSDYETRDVKRLFNAPVPTLVAAMLRAADKHDAETCLQTVTLLKSRFIETQDQRVKTIAAEVSA